MPQIRKGYFVAEPKGAMAYSTYCMTSINCVCLILSTTVNTTIQLQLQLIVINKRKATSDKRQARRVWRPTH